MTIDRKVKPSAPAMNGLLAVKLNTSHAVRSWIFSAAGAGLLPACGKQQTGMNCLVQ